MSEKQLYSTTVTTPSKEENLLVYATSVEDANQQFIAYIAANYDESFTWTPPQLAQSVDQRLAELFGKE